MAIRQLPQAWQALVPVMVNVKVCTLQVIAALAAAVESGEGNLDTIAKAFGHDQFIAGHAAGIIGQGGGGRPVGIVKHGLVQRHQDAVEGAVLTHAVSSLSGLPCFLPPVPNW